MEIQNVSKRFDDVFKVLLDAKMTDPETNALELRLVIEGIHGQADVLDFRVEGETLVMSVDARIDSSAKPIDLTDKPPAYTIIEFTDRDNAATQYGQRTVPNPIRTLCEDGIGPWQAKGVLVFWEPNFTSMYRKETLNAEHP
jgi:hypothetical protein